MAYNNWAIDFFYIISEKKTREEYEATKDDDPILNYLTIQGTYSNIVFSLLYASFRVILGNVYLLLLYFL